MQISGKLIEIADIQQISEGFKKRSFVIEYAENPQYIEYIQFELIQDRCDLLDGFTTGTLVSISFNIKGRKWTNPENQVRYFNTLQAWKIDPITSKNMEGNNQNMESSPSALNGSKAEDDDLPF